MTSINWSNVTSLTQMPAAANTASSGTFWIGTLYMMWIILMILLSFFGFEVAILIGSFLALIVGLLMVYAGLVAWPWILTFVGVILFMFLYIIWSSNKK